MAKGIILAESRPSSPDREQENDTWYDESARRLPPVNGDGPCVARHQIEADDLQAVPDNVIAGAGRLHMSDALQLDPPPTMRPLEPQPSTAASEDHADERR
jgi:hypothetical protein